MERVDACPQAGRPEVVGLGHGDETGARRGLGIGRNRILEVAKHHVDLRDQLRHLGAYLLDVRRDEVDHAFQLERKVAQRGRRADREWLEEVARELHGRPNFPLPSTTPGFPLRYGERLSLAKPLLRSPAERLTNSRAAVRPPHARRHQFGAAILWLDLPRIRL